MTTNPSSTFLPIIPVLPYSLIVGQSALKLALELAYIVPRLGGVLLSGHRGTGKSTAVRAFAQMVYSQEQPLVVLPINATEDRVVGGWDINELMQSKTRWQEGLLMAARDKLLYVDEVNLLDDHIVNIILDVTATGKLVVAREGKSESYDVPFTLVGTMNPEEGGLRPQLLDRFGLMVNVTTGTEPTDRLQILQNVLRFEDEWEKRQQNQSSDFLDQAKQADRDRFDQLKEAKARFSQVQFDAILQPCVDLATAFAVEGNRGERVLAMAARAYAARENQPEVTLEHLAVVAPLALQHRRPAMTQSNDAVWTEKETMRVKQVLGLG
jgi:magnesium chelatase subunit I